MPTDLGGIIGGGVGGILGSIGGLFGANARKRALERFRARQQEGIRRARDVTEERVSALLDNPLLQSATQFIQRSFSGETDPLTEQFQKRLEVAQESRGLRRSTAGAVAEASALAAFRQNFLAGLLPQAERFGTLGERFRGQILQQELPIGIGFETGGQIPGVSQFTPDITDPTGFDPVSAALSGLTSGGIGGFQIGSQFDQIAQQNRFLDELRSSRSSFDRGDDFKAVLDRVILGAR